MVQNKSEKNFTFVLVHGAWAGSWVWEKIIPILESLRHRVIAVDLPGNGTRQNTTLRDQWFFGLYALFMRSGRCAGWSHSVSWT